MQNKQFVKITGLNTKNWILLSEKLPLLSKRITNIFTDVFAICFSVISAIWIKTKYVLIENDTYRCLSTLVDTYSYLLIKKELIAALLLIPLLLAATINRRNYIFADVFAICCPSVISAIWIKTKYVLIENDTYRYLSTLFDTYSY